MNDDAVVVGGSAFAGGGGAFHAFTWSASTGMIDINPKGYTQSGGVRRLCGLQKCAT